MKAQPHYASVRANRFIAMDPVDPAIDFLALAAAMGCTGAGSTAPVISLRRWRPASPD